MLERSTLATSGRWKSSPTKGERELARQIERGERNDAMRLMARAVLQRHYEAESQSYDVDDAPGELWLAIPESDDGSERHG